MSEILWKFRQILLEAKICMLQAQRVDYLKEQCVKLGVKFAE